MDSFFTLDAWVQTLILSVITWLLTTLGALTIFFIKKSNEGVINFLLALSAGIMIASAIFSLIIPSIEQSRQLYSLPFLVPSLGLLLGGLFVVIGDVILDRTLERKIENCQSKKRSILMLFAITLHNIPEGMCIGVAIAGAKLGGMATINSAIMLALGIGIQNLPEGASVSLPLISENVPKWKAFLYGSLSGIVEPIFAVIACIFAINISNILPFLLSFSAGAMICVSCTELISESCKYSKNLASIGLITGFFIMMILDLMF